MTREQQQELEKVHASPITLEQLFQQLEDKSDRTLLYGYDVNGMTWHTYIHGGNLFHVQYDHHDKEYYNWCCGGEDEMYPGYIIPSKRLYPEACDYEFCKLLKQQDEYLPFTTFNPDQEPQQYHGLLLHQLKS